MAQNKKGHNPKQLRRTSTESFLIRHATDCKKSPCHSSSETNNLSKYETTQNYQTPKQNKTSATITNHWIQPLSPKELQKPPREEEQNK